MRSLKQRFAVMTVPVGYRYGVVALGASHLDSKKFVRGHTFTCDRKHWYILSSQGAEDAAQQKNFSGQTGSRCAGRPGSFVPRSRQYGRPFGMAARGKVWNVHSLGTVLSGGGGRILCRPGAPRGEVGGGGLRLVPPLYTLWGVDPTAGVFL